MNRYSDSRAFYSPAFPPKKQGQWLQRLSFPHTAARPFRTFTGFPVFFHSKIITIAYHSYGSSLPKTITKSNNLIDSSLLPFKDVVVSPLISLPVSRICTSIVFIVFIFWNEESTLFDKRLPEFNV